MTFQESELEFNFMDTSWKVLKYDEHRYYKILSGAGLKGIDFVGIYQNKKLVFFEIKNYRTHEAHPKGKFIIFEDMDFFVQGIKEKMEDTLMAIKVITKYLKRKFWYRAFLKLEQFIPTRLIKNQDWYFWHRINNLRESNTSKVIILWLEVDPNYSKKINAIFRAELQGKLIKAFGNINIEPIIANLKNPVFKTDLNVKKGF